MSKYSDTFKIEAIRLADRVGVKNAAFHLGIPYYTLADWRNHSKHKTLLTESAGVVEMEERLQQLEKENAELRKANEITNNILKEALSFLAEEKKTNFQ